MTTGGAAASDVEAVEDKGAEGSPWVLWAVAGVAALVVGGLLLARRN